jgi:hypothetical protein
MEFRDFCLIFVRRRNLFVGVVFACIAVALLVFRFQPARFETSLTLNVSRSGMHETQEYTYDQFYRLQADERFADTVVRWLAAPSVRMDVQEQAAVSKTVTDSISAKRLSSQMIAVTYVSGSRNGFGEMSTVVPEVLNREAGKLNELSKDTNWFAVVADEPVAHDARISFRFLLLLGALLGVFFGFWVVLVDWYFRGNEKERNIEMGKIE